MAKNDPVTRRYVIGTSWETSPVVGSVYQLHPQRELAAFGDPIPRKRIVIRDSAKVAMAQALLVSKRFFLTLKRARHTRPSRPSPTTIKSLAAKAWPTGPRRGTMGSRRLICSRLLQLVLPSSPV